jgi:hypothetical protein
MANPNFVATISSNEVWRGLDNTRCITDDLDTIEADILALEQAKPIEDSTHPGCYYRTVNNVTEWINPPMILGTEYRTIERWNGKVVYVKLVDCGMLPNNSTKTVTHGASASQIVRCLGQCLGNHTPIPRDWRGGKISIFADRINILITTNVDYSDQLAYAQIWYTKD